jgi:hypothetical protein
VRLEDLLGIVQQLPRGYETLENPKIAQAEIISRAGNGNQFFIKLDILRV